MSTGQPAPKETDPQMGLDFAGERHRSPAAGNSWPRQEQGPQMATPVPEEQIGWMERMLFDGRRWMSAREIMKLTQTHGCTRGDRDIREVASSCMNIISGQKGYKHIKHATAEEIQHSANFLISQGRKMIKRGISIRRRAHEMVG